MNKTKREIVDDIIDECYSFLEKKLKENGIEADWGSCDAVFYNDTDKKKTYAINFQQHECEEYEGE